MLDLTDKVLVLSGANGGISRAIARQFWDCGARLALSDLDAEGLQAFADELDPSGERVLVDKVDVSDWDDVEASVAHCQEVFGGADYLVTGAGIYLEKPFDEMSPGEWSRTIAVNLDGTFHLCRAIQPILRDGGAIVNIASVAGHRGSLRHAHYGAAKGGVLGLTRSLAQELAERNIRVNAVSPGIIDTVMVEHTMAARGNELIAATPLKRLGTAAEVASVVLFLCSDMASFVTGESVAVNGGLYIS
ncbi:MAG: SDR family NAD(P)-dependent oxidoreductase [Alphaproteobacteria bacterium]|jgi:3-oxoacyl-[acyl-carrier protein] reductase|nr:SDR family NAD(P)-dependent oxidoreductase [Alphaproteobacteria bacterium]